MDPYVNQLPEAENFTFKPSNPLPAMPQLNEPDFMNNRNANINPQVGVSILPTQVQQPAPQPDIFPTHSMKAGQSSTMQMVDMFLNQNKNHVPVNFKNNMQLNQVNSDDDDELEDTKDLLDDPPLG